MQKKPRAAAATEQALVPLIGLPLTSLWRFGPYQRFEFGLQKPHVNRKGQEITRADMALHVVCDWRIAGPDGHVVGSDNYGPHSARTDAHAQPFFLMLSQMQTTVLAITADDKRNLSITLAGGYRLDITVTQDADKETWVFLPPGERSFFPEGWSSAE